MFQIHHIGAVGPRGAWVPLYIGDGHVVAGIVHICTVLEHRGPIAYVQVTLK